MREGWDPGGQEAQSNFTTLKQLIATTIANMDILPCLSGGVLQESNPHPRFVSERNCMSHVPSGQRGRERSETRVT